MISLEYDPLNGKAIPDGWVKQLIQDIILKDTFATSYSTSNVFRVMRLAVVKKEISCNDVCFIFKGTVYSLDEGGRLLPSHPEGFCDLEANMWRASYKSSCDLLTPRR